MKNKTISIIHIITCLIFTIAIILLTLTSLHFYQLYKDSSIHSQYIMDKNYLSYKLDIDKNNIFYTNELFDIINSDPYDMKKYNNKTIVLIGYNYDSYITDNKYIFLTDKYFKNNHDDIDVLCSFTDNYNELKNINDDELLIIKGRYELDNYNISVMHNCLIIPYINN